MITESILPQPEQIWALLLSVGAARATRDAASHRRTAEQPGLDADSRSSADSADSFQPLKGAGGVDQQVRREIEMLANRLHQC